MPGSTHVLEGGRQLPGQPSTGVLLPFRGLSARLRAPGSRSGLPSRCGRSKDRRGGPVRGEVQSAVDTRVAATTSARWNIRSSCAIVSRWSSVSRRDATRTRPEPTARAARRWRRRALRMSSAAASARAAVRVASAGPWQTGRPVFRSACTCDWRAGSIRRSKLDLAVRGQRRLGRGMSGGFGGPSAPAGKAACFQGAGRQCARRALDVGALESQSLGQAWRRQQLPARCGDARFPGCTAALSVHADVPSRAVRARTRNSPVCDHQGRAPARSLGEYGRGQIS